MFAMEVENGVVVRIQEFPDKFTLAGGVLKTDAGYLAMHGAWYPLVAGAKEGDMYDPATETLTPKAVDLEAYKAGALRVVRAEVRAHIEVDWPLWRQQNVDAGILSSDLKAQKDSDVVACITESNRVEDLIDAATTSEEITAAVRSLNLPTLPVAI